MYTEAYKLKATVFFKGLSLQIKNLAPKKFAMQSKVCLESVHMGIIKNGSHAKSFKLAICINNCFLQQ